MIESPLIAELLAKAEAKGKAEWLVHVLQKRFKKLPEEVATAIHACSDAEQLSRWFDLALSARTLARFRQQTRL